MTTIGLYVSTRYEKENAKNVTDRLKSKVMNAFTSEVKEQKLVTKGAICPQLSYARMKEACLEPCQASIMTFFEEDI